MKKIYSFTTILTLVALMLLGQGCVKENGVDCPELGDNTLALRINVHEIAQSKAALRAEGKTEAGQDDPYNENKIVDFTVLFYKGGNLSWSQPSKGLTQDSNKNYIIPVPKEQMGEIDGKTEFKIYVVANHTFTGDKPAKEDALKAIVVSESIKVSNIEKPAKEKPAKFVMVGSVTKTINMSTTDGKQLGTVNLKRVASKVRLSLLTVNVDGYTQEGEAQAYLSNARNQGYMDKAENIGDLFPSDYRNVTEKITGIDKSAHFYSYYTKWEKDAKERPTLTLMIKLKKNDSTNTEAKAYYYKVPVEAKESELKSNYLYDVKVKIEILGGLTVEEPQKITGKLVIKDWTTHDDAFDLPATKYLLVAEKHVTMNNIATYNIDYQSSPEKISITNIKAFYSYTNASGISKDEEIYNGNVQYPKVTIAEKEKKNIIIESKIPENFVPKTIEFDVTNEAGFKEHVKVTQYPSLYITNTFGTSSYRRPYPQYNSDGSFFNESHLKNRAIYRINILVPGDNILGVDMILGFPPLDYYGYTRNEPETANMVSPCFELASQLGATPIMTYDEARYNCEKYWEIRDGRALNDWRLPTEAEIRLVDEMQNAGKGVVKLIMTGRYYWDAYRRNGAYKMKKPTYDVKGSNYWKAAVRCVRDVKDNTVTK